MLAAYEIEDGDGDTIIDDGLSAYDDDGTNSHRRPRPLMTSSQAAAQALAAQHAQCCRVVAFLLTLTISLIVASVRLFARPGYDVDGQWELWGGDLLKKENELRLKQTLDFLISNNISDHELLVVEDGDTDFEVLFSGSSKTPQYRAARWISAVDRRRISIPPSGNEYQFLQRYALAVLYFSTGGGRHWTFGTNFLTGVHECLWFGEFVYEILSPYESFVFGAICDQNPDVESGVDVGSWGELSVVTHLSLPILNNMVGTLPQELQHLRYLKQIHIQFNPGITGTLPSEYGSFPYLQVINMKYLSLEGEIPSSFSSLENLEELDFERNNLSGDITFSTNLTNLRVLYLEYNPNITGTIPDELSNLTQLEVFSVSNTGMYGTIPQSMSSLTNLRRVALDDNNFSGSVAAFQNLKNLTHLYLEDNHFNDTIDENFLANLENLVHLDLSTNDFVGIIPGHFFRFPETKVIDMSANKLVGVLPADEISNANQSKIEFLSLHSNNITGPIPKSIKQLKNLTHLDLSLNHFTGGIISEIQELANLQYLFLGMNKFTEGPVPEWIRNLTEIDELSLKGSSLTGEIPEWIGNELLKLLFLDMGENALNGTIPPSLGNLTELTVLILNQNKLNGTVPLDLSKLENLEVFLLDDNDIQGNLTVMCARRDPINFFTADCASPLVNVSSEVTCECCSTCCNDENATCNDLEWLGNHEAIWERGYERWEWGFQAGSVSVFGDN